jgi:glycosyltransferase involved in cell wall biosynthesis
MRDSAIAHALRNMGHEVTLIPLYTPLRNERDITTTTEVFYGGVNVYLQSASTLFQKTPRLLDWVFDRPWLLNMAGRMGAQSDPAELAGLTVEILKGEDGAAAKELRRLTDFLRDTVKPQVIVLPNLMFAGMAREFRERVGVPVVCELTGEDIFLDAMRPADRERVRQVIRARAADVTKFVATSHFYAGKMADYLGTDASDIEVVYTGLSQEYFEPPTVAKAATGVRKRPLTIGYVARQCPEKGLGLLIDAMSILRGMANMWTVRLKVAGYAGARDAEWLAALKRRADAAGLRDQIDWQGEVDVAGKIRLLDAVDVFTAPTTMPEPKGISVLEAMARGVPVVQPDHGSFPEMIRMTGGGTLVGPNDAEALAHGLADLLRDEPRRRRLGEAGRRVVAQQFTERGMALEMVRVFESLTAVSFRKAETVGVAV